MKEEGQLLDHQQVQQAQDEDSDDDMERGESVADENIEAEENEVKDLETIVNWDKYFKKLTAVEQQLYTHMIPKIDEFKEIVHNTEGWETLVDD